MALFVGSQSPFPCLTGCACLSTTRCEAAAAQLDRYTHVQGETPPGIRNDINDRPPDPAAEPTPPSTAPRRKPWQQAATADGGNLPAALMHLGGATTPQPSPASADRWIRSPPASVGSAKGSSRSAQRMEEARALLEEAAAATSPRGGAADVTVRRFSLLLCCHHSCVLVALVNRPSCCHCCVFLPLALCSCSQFCLSLLLPFFSALCFCPVLYRCLHFLFPLLLSATLVACLPSLGVGLHQDSSSVVFASYEPTSSHVMQVPGLGRDFAQGIAARQAASSGLGGLEEQEAPLPAVVPLDGGVLGGAAA